ncbi:hypothetical protein D3C72_985380 [compost metagenome]
MGHFPDQLESGSPGPLYELAVPYEADPRQERFIDEEGPGLAVDLAGGEVHHRGVLDAKSHDVSQMLGQDGLRQLLNALFDQTLKIGRADQPILSRVPVVDVALGDIIGVVDEDDRLRMGLPDVDDPDLLPVDPVGRRLDLETDAELVPDSLVQAVQVELLELVVRETQDIETVVLDPEYEVAALVVGEGRDRLDDEVDGLFALDLVGFGNRQRAGGAEFDRQQPRQTGRAERPIVLDGRRRGLGHEPMQFGRTGRRDRDVFLDLTVLDVGDSARADIACRVAAGAIDQTRDRLVGVHTLFDERLDDSDLGVGQRVSPNACSLGRVARSDTHRLPSRCRRIVRSRRFSTRSA